MFSASWLATFLVAETFLCGMLVYAWRQARRRQRRLAARLDAHEVHLQRLTAVAELGLAVLDSRGDITDWNPALARLYGCSRADALGQAFFTRFVPATESAALQARVRALRSSDDVFEFSFAVAQGPECRPRQLRWRARHFTEPRSGQRWLSLVGHDVTELEVAVGKLAESEARFRRLFESVPVALALIDLKGRLHMANAACARLFGFEAAEQMVALGVSDLIRHDEDRLASTVALAALRAGTEVHHEEEVCCLRRDGQLRWGHARVVLVEMGPEQRYYLASISDVHERKQTETALLESERRLAMLIGNLSGAVYRYELPAGATGLHHDHAPQFLSAGVQALTGQDRTEFLRPDEPQVLGDLIDAEDRAAVQQALQAAMRGDGRFELRYRLQHPQGPRQVAEHGLAWQRPDGSWSVDGHLTALVAEPPLPGGEQALRRLLAGAGSGLLSLTPQGRVLDVDATCCRLLDLPPPEQVMGHALQPLLVPGHASALDLALGRILAEGGLPGVEFSYRHRDGRLCFLQASALVVQEGEQTVVKGLLTDVSERRDAVQAAQLAALHYRQLFEVSSEALCLVSLQGRVEQANPALCRLLGQPAAALQGQNLGELGPDDWLEVDRQAQEQLAGRAAFEPYRKTLWRGDGTEMPVQLQGWLLRDDQGRPQHLLCAVREWKAAPPLPAAGQTAPVANDA